MNAGLTTAARVAGFAAVLLLVFAGAWWGGGQVEPVGADPTPEQPTSTSPGPGEGHDGTSDTHE